MESAAEQSMPPAEVVAEEVKEEKEADTKEEINEPSTNVYFWGVPNDYTEFEMNLLVFACGDVVSLRMGPSNGKGFKYAFVQFTKLEEAETAIKLLHQRRFNARNLVVRYAKPPKAATNKRGAVNTAILQVEKKKLRRTNGPNHMYQQPNPNGGYGETYPQGAYGAEGYPATAYQDYSMGRGYGMDMSMQMPAAGYGMDYQQYGAAATRQAYGQQQQAYGYGASGYNNAGSKFANAPLSSTNVYVNGLPENITDAALEQLFGGYGTVVSTKIIMNRNTGKPLGTALVRMENHQQAAAAIEGINGRVPFGGTEAVSCRFANEKRMSSSSTTNLYISGLPEDVTEQALKDMFGKHGNVVSQKIIINRNTGLPLGTALVRMETNEQAQACISTLQGTQTSPGRFLSVRFAAEKAKTPTK